MRVQYSTSFQNSCLGLRQSILLLEVMSSSDGSTPEQAKAEWMITFWLVIQKLVKMELKAVQTLVNQYVIVASNVSF